MSIRISVAIAAVLVAAATQAGAAQNLSRHATIAADATIDVSNVAGRVDVTAWDRNEIELTAVLEDDKDKLEFEATDRQVRIKVVRPNEHYDGHREAVLTLKIPKGARISTETVSADITVAGVLGEQRLESVSGDVRTQAYDAPVKLSTVSGDGTVNGTGGKAAVTVASVSGGLKINLVATERLNAKAISGDIDAHAELMPNARVEMETVSGEIKLTMKPPVNAEFDMESFSGDIENCFGQKARDKSRYGPGSELRFTQGSGGARVSINSLSGDIKICDR